MPARRRRSPPASPKLSPILVVAPLAAFAAVFLWDGPPRAAAVPTAADRERAAFAPCSAGGRRAACVVDGDTFWYRGAKIRVADINTPETSSPKCGAEARLGAQATRRFTELLNQGAFTLEPVERETDAYGRKLFVVTRGGESLGAALVAEGLAERWRGYRRSWC